MISLDDYKKALGKVTDDLSEEEILRAQKIQDDLAELFYVMWRMKLQINKSIIESTPCLIQTEPEIALSTVA